MLSAARRTAPYSMLSPPRLAAGLALVLVLGAAWLARPAVAARIGPQALADAAVAAPAANGAGSNSSSSAAANGFETNFDGSTLQDQDGRPFALAALRGKIVLYNFVYTGCSTICPVQTRALADLRKGMDPTASAGLHIVSVTLDPLTDSPAVLKAYAKRMGASATGWSFVTGRPQDIERVADRLRLFGRDPQARRPDDHATALWLVDSGGQVVQRYAGVMPDTARLRREIQTLHAMGGRAGQSR